MILVSVLVTEQMRHVDLNYELGSYKHTIHTHALLIHYRTVVSGFYEAFGTPCDYILETLPSSVNNMNYFVFLQNCCQFHHDHHCHHLIFYHFEVWTFKGDVETHFPPSCLCKYFFVYVCVCVSENTTNVLRFILDFFFVFLHQMLMCASLRYNLPLRAWKKWVNK